MTSVSATNARRELFALIRRTTQGHRVYRIQHREGSAVLMSEEDYEGLLETLELLSVPGFRQSIRRSLRQMRRGETVSLDEALGAGR